MKIGVSSYSFTKFIRREGNDVFAAIRKAAEMGFELIEFAGLCPPDGEDELSHAGRLRRACEAAGLPVVCYAVAADFLSPHEGRTMRDEIERLKQQVRIAAELGAPLMRHDASRGLADGHDGSADFAAAVDPLADCCRDVAEFAAALGVKTSVENHGFFVQDSDRCEMLTRRVGHPNFGWLVDIGNFLCADEDPVSATARMAPYAVHCHVKDFHVKPPDAVDPGTGWFRSRGGALLRGAIVGHGSVDVPACLRALKSAGYDGACSIEFEGLEDCVPALEIGLENLRRYLDE